MVKIEHTVKAKLAENPGLESHMRAGWNVISQAIHEYAVAQRPKMKVFEVHHLTEIARRHYFQAVVDGYSVDAARCFVLENLKLKSERTCERV